MAQADADESSSANLLRVLVSTDNHLGVWEKDEIRKDDSFVAFEEVLQMAVELNVDLLLLGGDLFHENKPSRATLVKTMQLFTKYCLGDKPIHFRILSDQALNFVAGRVNFDNPNINIGLPVMTIHGNHDDPAGADNLSAVDILSSAGLLNYFGKILLGGSAIGRITLSPVLLQKGHTRVALYGLGSVRDERLGRLFQTPGAVQWVRPAPMPNVDTDDWHSVLVLHQNRVQRTVAGKSCIQEKHIPDFFDLVVWGHEHECRADAEEICRPTGFSSTKEPTNIIQPGSTVATALSEGESKHKHAVLLEFLGSQWRSIKQQLRTVRPFVWDQVVLSQQDELDPEKPDGVVDFLERKVQAMIKVALRERPTAAGEAPMLPLVRLRIDYTGFTTINSQRFGQKFVGKVANPHDMLLWAKAVQRRTKNGENGAEVAEQLGVSGLRPEQLDQSKMEDLICQHLQENLQILPEEELAAALHNFVQKDEKSALTDCVAAALRETQNVAAATTGAEAAVGSAAASGRRGAGDDDVEGVVSLAVQTRKAKQAPRSIPRSTANNGAGPSTSDQGAPGDTDQAMADADGDLLEEDSPSRPSADENKRPRVNAAKPPLPVSSSRGGGGRQAGIMEAFAKGNSQRTATTAPSPSKTSSGTRSARGRGSTARGRSAAASRKRGSRVIDDDDDDDGDAADLISDDDDDDGGRGSMRPPPAKRVRAGGAGGRVAAAAATPSSRPRRRAGAAGKNLAESPAASDDGVDEIESLVTDDEDVDGIEDGDTQPSSRRAAAASTGRRGTQATTTTSQPAASRRRGAADGTAVTPAKTGLAGGESFIDSDEDTAVLPQSKPSSGRRRALPASLGGSAPSSQHGRR